MVLFTDETVIDLNRCKGKFWHVRGKRHTVAKTKHPLKRMFWAGFCFKSSTPLIQIRGTINSESYIRLLEDDVLPWMRRKRVTSMLFQQDNAPAHVSRRTKGFFETKNIRVLDWPANSPDLNPIENAWSLLKSKVAARCPKTLAELEHVASEEWEKIPRSYFESLINSMPRRINQVIERSGGKADY